jgi:hypothetical protein
MANRSVRRNHHGPDAHLRTFASDLHPACCSHTPRTDYRQLLTPASRLFSLFLCAYAPQVPGDGPLPPTTLADLVQGKRKANHQRNVKSDLAREVLACLDEVDLWYAHHNSARPVLYSFALSHTVIDVATPIKARVLALDRRRATPSSNWQSRSCSVSCSRPKQRASRSRRAKIR